MALQLRSSAQSWELAKERTKEMLKQSSSFTMKTNGEAQKSSVGDYRNRTRYDGKPER